MASIEIGTLVVGGGHMEPRAYQGAKDYGREVEPWRVIFRASMRDGASGYIAQPETVVPWEAVEAVDPKDERIRAEKHGRWWRDALGREYGTKRAAVLAERVRIAHDAFHGVAS